MSIIAAYIVPHPPIIIPDIGGGDEKKINKTIAAYHQIAKEISELKPDTIILSTPHAIAYKDYFHISSVESMQGDLNQFGGSDFECYPKSDLKLVEAIEKRAKRLGFPMGTLGMQFPKLDHGSMVPLYFVNKYYDDYKLVLVSPSGLSKIKHYEAGKIIQSVIDENKKVVWIASGDLSHKLKEDGPYGFVEQGPVFDKRITEALSKGDFLELLSLNQSYQNKVGECGIGSFTMMAGCLDGLKLESELLSYEGPFGVGYSIVKYTNFTKSPERAFDIIYHSIIEDSVKHLREKEDDYVQLARKSLEYFVKNKAKLKVPDDIIDDLKTSKAGVFVTLHKKSKLRGCIGTVLPTKDSIAEEIIENAISAGMRDYRFDKVTDHELEQLEYSVDVLLPLEEIESKDQLDVTKYGVVVSSGHKRGLLLPNIDGIDTVDEQIEVAKQKAGINDYEDFHLHRFEVIRHH